MKGAVTVVSRILSTILASDLLARELKLPVLFGFLDVGMRQNQYEGLSLV
jgi:hypothetical protein